MWGILLLLAAAQGALYDTYTGELMADSRAQEIARLNLTNYCAIEVADCDPHERRRLDCSCNNLHYPPRGATMTPYGRLLPPLLGPDFRPRPAKNGEELPRVRDVRVAIISDGRRSSHDYTQLVTHVGVSLAGDVTSVHDTVNYVVFTRDCCRPGSEDDPRCLPIRVSDDDVHLRRSNVRCMNLTSPITYQGLGCTSSRLPPARINTSPPLLELTPVYGNTAMQAARGRARVGGRILTELYQGKEWPPTGSALCLLNNPLRGETRCHNSANPAINAVLGTNLLGMWFIRNHNQLARALEAINPCWDDEELFMTARDINIAQWQQMLYYEFFPTVMGYDYLVKQGAIYNTHGHVDDYDETLEPYMSLEFILVFRWFHVMQEGRLRFYNRQGKLINEEAIVDYTLRTGALALNNTLEAVTLGSFRQPASKTDVVDPDIGERILGSLQTASDVVSSDIMKGRAAGLPPYNHYRKLCGLPHARTFKDLLHWMNEEKVIPLQTTYRDVDDIELLPGIIAESPLPGAVVPPTLGCIMTKQMKRWRQADRFWYENSVHPGSFTTAQLMEIRKFLLSRLLCDHGEGVEMIQPYAFLLPGLGNEMRKCSDIPAMNMEAWRSKSCMNKTQYSSWVNY